MVHMLTEEDKVLLNENPRLVECLFDKIAKGPCDRLIVHRAAATNVLNMHHGIAGIAIQRLDNPPTLSRADDVQAYRRVPEVASMIKIYDPNLVIILEAQGKAYIEAPRMCELYARLVIGHENDRNCDQILHELKQVGLPTTSAGTCD
jgi:hypothetical protein